MAKYFRTLTLLLFLLLIFGCPSNDPGPEQEPIDYSDLNLNFLISNNVTGECVKGKPGIAFDGTNFMVVWQRGIDDYNIYAKRISPSGLLIDSTDIPVSVGLNQSSYFPSIAFDGNNFLVVWIALRNSSSEIYGARVTKNGTVLDPGGIKLTTGADPFMRMPAIAFDGTNYLIIWRTNSSDIYGTRISTGLTNLDAAGGFVISDTNTSYYPAVAFDGTNYMVSWHDGRNSGISGWDIYAARVSREGVVLEPDGFVVCEEEQHQEHNTVAFDGTNYIITWYDWRPNNDQVYGSLYTARVSTNGIVLDSPAIFISNDVRGQWSPQIASSGEDSLIVWNMEMGQGLNARLWDVYGTRISPSGEILDRGINISTSFWHQAQPIIGYGGGSYLIAWNDIERSALYGQIIGKDEIGYTSPYTQREIVPGNWNKQIYEFGYEGACAGITFAENDAYIFGDHSIVQYAGSDWYLTESIQTPYCSWAYNRDFIFIGGWAGLSYLYNGQSWSQQRGIDESSIITGIFGTNIQNIWVTTDKGGLYKFAEYNGSLDYQSLFSIGPIDFEDIWGTGPDNIYIVGEKGAVIHYNGHIWSRENNIPIKQTLNSIWGTSEENIYIVGDWGTILHFNGSTWSLHESCTKENLYAIWGVNSTNIYAVGNNGTIIHYNGSYWEPEDGGTVQDLITVFGYNNPSLNNYTVWVAGTGNEILKKVAVK